MHNSANYPFSGYSLEKWERNRGDESIAPLIDFIRIHIEMIIQ